MSSQIARPGRLRSWFATLPWWARAAVGAVSVILGVVILVRPATSLGALAVLIGAGLVLSGILELVGGGQGEDGERTPRWRALTGLVWVAAGVFVLLFPDLTVRMVAVVVAIALLVNGLMSMLASFRPGMPLDARIASALLGLAGIGLGVLALLTPDITLLIACIAVGARLIAVGLLELWRVARARVPRITKTDAVPPVAARWMRTIAVIVALVLAVGAGGLSAALRTDAPVDDDFYAAPRTVPDEPGRLIRSEAFTRGIPDAATGWRILYTTTNGDGSPTVASGLVVVPAEGFGEWPVIAWTHGTTGFAQQCAPSLLDEPFEAGALFVLPDVVANGWALVSTDYIGLGTPSPHPYLIGEPSGRAELDAVRAAREIEAADLGAQTVAWGHSQGGGAALWAGAIAAEYAPDVPLAGVAALAPAADLLGLVGNLSNVPGGSIFAAYAMAAYSALYDDVTDGEYLRPEAEDAARQMAARCLTEPGREDDPDILAASPTEGPLGARLAENAPPPTVAVPLLLAQGKDDGLVVPAAQDAFVAAACGAGEIVDYRLYAGLGHVDLVVPASPLVPQLMEWTKARLSGEPGIAGCNRAEY